MGDVMNMRRFSAALAAAALCLMGWGYADTSAASNETVAGKESARAWLDQLLTNLDLPPSVPAKTTFGSFKTKPFATHEVELCHIDQVELDTDSWYGIPPKVESPARFSGVSVRHVFFYLSDPDHIPALALTEDLEMRCRSGQAPWSAMIDAKSAGEVQWGFTVLRAMLKQAAKEPRSIVFDCDTRQDTCAGDIAKTDIRKLSSVEMCNQYVDGDGCFEYDFDGRHLNLQFDVKEGFFGSQTIVISRVRSRYDWIE